MTDVRSWRELEMLHEAEKCRCSHLHVKRPGKKGSSYVVRGAAPTSSLILQSPTTCQRIVHVSHRYKWACTERLPVPSWPFASLSPGLWPGLRATEITAQQYFWTLDKLATSVKISYRFNPSCKFFPGDVPISFCGTRTSVINVHYLKYFMILCWHTINPWALSSVSSLKGFEAWMCQERSSHRGLFQPWKS